MSRIAIIACETFKRELDHLTQDDEDIVYKEYLEFGLHEYPQDLKAKVIEKVNSMEGRADAVLLGYGICQSLKDVTKDMRLPCVMLTGDDCIGVLLTQAEYDVERKKCAGTWYATPYFSEMGMDWFRKDMRKKMGPSADELDFNYILKLLFDGYSRCLFIDTGVGDRSYFEELAHRFADELGLKHEAREGTLDGLRDALEQVKKLAIEHGS